jgi:hypothetical protein
MDDNKFVVMVRRYFSFLIREYGYSTREEIYSHESLGDALVEFWSPATLVSIRLDRFDIILLMGPFGEEKVARLSPEILIDFLTAGKNKLLEGHVESGGNLESKLEFELIRYAKVLREYCDPILRGDFSMWLDALKFFIRKMQKDYHSWSGLDLPVEVYKPIEDYIKTKESK